MLGVARKLFVSSNTYKNKSKKNLKFYSSEAPQNPTDHGMVDWKAGEVGSADSQLQINYSGEISIWLCLPHHLKVQHSLLSLSRGAASHSTPSWKWLMRRMSGHQAEARARMCKWHAKLPVRGFTSMCPQQSALAD